MRCANRMQSGNSCIDQWECSSNGMRTLPRLLTFRTGRKSIFHCWSSYLNWSTKRMKKQFERYRLRNGCYKHEHFVPEQRMSFYSINNKWNVLVDFIAPLKPFVMLNSVRVHAIQPFKIIYYFRTDRNVSTNYVKVSVLIAIMLSIKIPFPC